MEKLALHYAKLLMLLTVIMTLTAYLNNKKGKYVNIMYYIGSLENACIST